MTMKVHQVVLLGKLKTIKLKSKSMMYKMLKTMKTTKLKTMTIKPKPMI